MTAYAVKAAKPGTHSDGGGLYLQVSETGSRSWVFRYTLAGRKREMGLGGTHTFGLALARTAAAEFRRQVHEGLDPIEVRRAAQAAQAVARARAMTFDQCAKAYIAAHDAAWRNEKHRAQWSATLTTYASPVFGSLPVAAVDQALVLQVLEPLWRTKTETASRLRGRIEKVLDFAKSRGLRTGDNPAAWKGNLALHLPQPGKVAKVEHHTALPYGELPGFMVKLRTMQGIGARALEVAILCASRTGEVIGATWSEVDLDRALWSIPAERMKAGREHRVPLSAPALATLRALPREGEYVFPGGRAGGPLSNMAMTATLRRMGRGDLTVHGFRSCFRDWVAESTSYPPELAEAALAHTNTNKVEAAYLRSDRLEKRTALMNDWARFADGVTATVVSIANNKAAIS